LTAHPGSRLIQFFARGALSDWPVTLALLDFAVEHGLALLEGEAQSRGQMLTHFQTPLVLSGASSVISKPPLHSIAKLSRPLSATRAVVMKLGAATYCTAWWGRPLLSAMRRYTFSPSRSAMSSLGKRLRSTFMMGSGTGLVICHSPLRLRRSAPRRSPASAG